MEVHNYSINCTWSVGNKLTGNNNRHSLILHHRKIKITINNVFTINHKRK